MIGTQNAMQLAY